MPKTLALNVVADDKFRADVLDLVREQVRPVVRELVKEMLTPDLIEKVALQFFCADPTFNKLVRAVTPYIGGELRATKEFKDALSNVQAKVEPIVLTYLDKNLDARIRDRVARTLAGLTR